jgi:hypothetical protein
MRASPPVGAGRVASASAVAGATLLVFIAAAVLLVWLGPRLLTTTEGLSPPQADEARERVRTSLLALAAGFIALVGAIYTARTFALNRRGQITDRFSHAIEHLGSDSIEVRLGGIYALEHIARESEADHGPIMEVLTAYVRVRSPRGDLGDRRPGMADADIRAVLTVLTRRRLDYEQRRPIAFDLGFTDLTRVEAPGLHLPSAALGGVRLAWANLEGADFGGAFLARADLGWAELSNANLSEATLNDADLGAASFRGADLRRSNLQGSNLQGANLAGADLQGARLVQANLTHALLLGARLEGADLSGAAVEGAVFDLTQLEADRERWENDARFALLPYELRRDATADEATRWP